MNDDIYYKYQDSHIKRSLYIFVTMDVSRMGGVQAYVAMKAKFLREVGCDVNLVFPSPRKKTSKFIELKQYCNNNVPELGYPPYIFKDNVIVKVINRIEAIVENSHDFDSIIVESHDDILAMWGEIIAKALKAKHIFVLMGEDYRENMQRYNKINFYIYKLYRKEVMGSPQGAQHFFYSTPTIYNEQINNYTNNFLIDEEPVQDIEDKRVDAIKREPYDYNICYIGRTNKAYVPNIIRGVADFSRKHPDRKLQFVLVGDANIVKEQINNSCKNVKNLHINKIGELVPIPKSLFSKVDVFIAGSGSARCVAYEGAKVIVAGTVECLSLGVLGIDTQDSVYWDGKSEKLPFDLALEKVLIENAYDGMTVNYPKQGVEYCTKQNFEAIARSEQKQEYYDIDELTQGTKVNYLKFQLKTFILGYFPGLIVFIKKFFLKQQ